MTDATNKTLPAIEPVLTYNPYTYLPIQRAFFSTSNFGPMPDRDAAIAKENPSLATHIKSVWNFLDWMRTSNPELYSVITNQRPDLADAGEVVLNGKVSVNSAQLATAKSGLSGLGEVSMSPFYWEDIPEGTLTTPASADYIIGDTSAPTDTTTLPITEWGTSILNTLQSALPAYFQAKSQSDLMRINIARAEQGLPPIDSSTLAPTLNVGVSPGVQQFMYLAVGGLVVVGLFASFKKSGK